MIYLQDSKNVSRQKPMVMQSDSILEQCQFSSWIQKGFQDFLKSLEAHFLVLSGKTTSSNEGKPSEKIRPGRTKNHPENYRGNSCFLLLWGIHKVMRIMDLLLSPVNFASEKLLRHEMKYVKPLRLLGDALKTNVSVPGRFLGLDVGDKYVGLAISDLSNMVASPLSVLLRKKTNIDLMATDFQNLIKTFSVSGLVVGYPFGKLNNVEDVVTVNLFIEELGKTEKLNDVKYTYWDERLSSKTVELMLKPLNLHPVQEKTMLDKLAAVVILQEYLDYANRYMDTEPAE